MRRCASRPLTAPGASGYDTLARPPFALNRLHELDPEHLLYERAKPGPGGSGPRRQMPLGIYRHRYFDVLARTAAHRGLLPPRHRPAAVGRLPPVALPDSGHFGVRLLSNSATG